MAGAQGGWRGLPTRSIATLTSEHGGAPLARPALLNKPPSGVAPSSRRGHSTAARGGPARRTRPRGHGRHAGPVAPHARGARHHRGRHDAATPGGAARTRDHEVCPRPRRPPPPLTTPSTHNRRTAPLLFVKVP